MSVKPGPAQAFASTGLLTFFSSGGNSGDTVQQLTSSMRQKQSLALLSCDLHRKSVVPIVQNVPVVPIANACCGQFQSFQPFNRYAPFKAFKTELGVRAMHRELLETDGIYVLHEPSEAYTRNLTGENEALSSENTLPWNESLENPSR